MSEEKPESPLFAAAKRLTDEAVRVGQLCVRLEAEGRDSVRKQAALAVKSARYALAEVEQLVKDGGGK